VLVCFLLFTAGRSLRAERLPVHTYTIADGLALDGAIFETMQDSRGFLWFVTGGSISRFDGQSFQNHGANDGLPWVNCMLETRAGEYWLGTVEGVIRYVPAAAGAGRFERFQISPTRIGNQIATLASDGANGLWIGTDDGLYHATRTRSGLDIKQVLRPESPLHSEPDGYSPIIHVLLDSRGALWATGTYSGVYRIRADGGIEHYTTRDGLPYLNGGPFLEDRGKRMWLATAVGLLSLEAQPQPGRRLVRRQFETRFGPPENAARGLCETQDGHLWIATEMGLLEFDGDRLRRYTRRNGLAEDSLWSVLRDREGNLWAGTGSSGTMRISRAGFTTFDESDGSRDASVRSVQMLPNGEVIAVPGPASNPSFRIQQFTGGKTPFRLIRPRFPANIKKFGWGTGQILLRDHLGETWIATYSGVARFPYTDDIAGLDGLRPARIYNMRDGLRSTNIYSLFEDSRGDIWIGLLFPPQFGLARWIRAQDRIEDLTGTAGAMPGKTSGAFVESRSGTLWIGCWPNGLSRFRNGKFQSFAVSDGLPKGSTDSLYNDINGTVWGSSQHGGLFRIENPDSARPRFIIFSEANGLSTNDVLCVTGDAAGRIYAGTFKGVDRLDPASGELLHFNTSDGLASNLISTCACDRSGALWFGTHHGLSRLTNPPGTFPTPPQVRISEVRIADQMQPISDLGETRIGLPELRSSQNRVSIAFAAINFAGATRYRYKLEGAQTEWSQTAEPLATYPALPAGDYRFLVQALGAGPGQVSPAASLTFTILSPLWRRWWFLGLEALALAGCIYAAYWFRLRQLLAVERVRMRIAIDLHDDIGSALSQIGLLSEAARRPAGAQTMPDALARIAAVSRETATSMADIVWTINPQRDSLGDLSVRIRRFASELFSARDIDCVVVTPESDEELKLGIDTRRQLLLVAKEAMHNVIRHAHGTRVSIELKHEGRWLVFRISDNGAGFDPQARPEGHGIASMRSRAEGLRGKLTIESGNGHGTKLEVRIPK
jgi:signal transduction histidine kinase/ligand-binding sensor domain-containing protein